MSREQARRAARADAQLRRRTAKRAERFITSTEQRVSGVWLVQLAAWTRPLLGTRLSWALLQRAMRRVRLEQRHNGGEWYRVSVGVEVQPNGQLRLVPRN